VSEWSSAVVGQDSRARAVCRSFRPSRVRGRGLFFFLTYDLQEKVFIIFFIYSIKRYEFQKKCWDYLMNDCP
jgi:hypothetical protein